MEEQRKVAVIGWDSATFDVIQPLLAQGSLPNLEKCISEGLSGILKSTMHPLTPPAWTSFMTGVNPGQHGVFDFVGLQEDGRFQLTTGGNIRYPTLWSRLSAAGKRVVVMNVPMTYPPERVNGMVIAGMDAPTQGRASTYPPELSQWIEHEFGQFRTDVKARSHGNQTLEQFTEQYVEELCRLVHSHGSIAYRLLQEEQPDFFCSVFIQPDRVQHALGHLIKDGVTPDDGIGRVYRALDTELGRLLSLMDERWTVFLVSDHGASTYRRVFELDTWLAREGWLHLRGPRILDRWVEFAGLLRRNVARRLGFQVRQGSGFHSVLGRIEWPQTKAFSVGAFGSIYLNTCEKFPHGTIEYGSIEYENLCARITDGLMSYRDPENGCQIVSAVHRSDQIYHGQSINLAPDLLVETTNEYFIRNNLEHSSGLLTYAAGQYGKRSLQHTARHTMDGVFFARGRDVAQSLNQQWQADIVDLAPTILYLFDIEIPKDIDGRARTEWFPTLVRQPRIAQTGLPQFVAVTDVSFNEIETAQVQQRLRYWVISSSHSVLVGRTRPTKQMPRLLANSASLTIAQFVRIVANSVLSIIVARHLGPAGLGQFAILTAYFLLFQSIATLGVPGYLIRTIARNNEAYASYFHSALNSQLFSAIFAALLLSAVGHILGYTPEVASAIDIVAVCLIPFAISSTIEAVFQGLEQMGNVALSQVVARLVQLTGSIILLYFGFGVIGLAWMLLLGQTVSALVGVWLTTKYLHIWRGYTFDWAGSLSLIVHSFDFFLLTFTNNLFAKLDTLILSFFASDTVTGYYNAAFLVIQVATLSVMGLAGAVFPRLSRLFHSDYPKFRRLLDTTLRSGVIYGLLVTLVLEFAAVPLVRFIYQDPSYYASSSLLQILAPFVTISTINLVVSSGMVAANLQRNSIIISSTKLVVSLILYVLLTRFWLATGTALATVLSALVAALLNLMFFNRNVYQLDLWRALFKPMLLAILTFGVLGWAGQSWPVAAALLSVVFFLTLLLIFKVVSRQDFELTARSISVMVNGIKRKEGDNQ